MYKIETHLHTCHSSPCGKVDADTIAYGKEHPELLQLCGSDFHRLEDVGCGGIGMEILPNDEEELVSLLRQKKYMLL